MADYVEGVEGSSPPSELVLAWRCERWQTLPEGGGLFDQPLAVMTAMETAQFTYDAFSGRLRAAKRNRLVEWSEEHPRMAEFCAVNGR